MTACGQSARQRGQVNALVGRLTASCSDQRPASAVRPLLSLRSYVLRLAGIGWEYLLGPDSASKA